MSCSLIVNMMSLVNIRDLCKWGKTIYIMTFRMAFAILDMIVFHFSLQGGDVMEHNDGKCHVFTFKYVRGRYS